MSDEKTRSQQPDNVVPIAPGASIRQVGQTSSREEWEFTADAEGTIFVAAGRWLNERQGTSEERTVEAVNWTLAPDGYRISLRLTVSRL